MATRKRQPRKSGGTFDVKRVVSVGQDRKTGEAILRFRAEDCRVVALESRFGQDDSLVYLGDQTAMFVKGKGLGA